MTLSDKDTKRLQKRINRRGPRVSLRITYKTVPIRKKDSKTTTYKTRVVMV